MVNRVIDWVLRREVQRPDVPQCPEHKLDMRLRGALGRPARFTYQSEEEYTYIYFCPVEGCNETAQVTRVKTQVPVPGETPQRPIYARMEE